MYLPTEKFHELADVIASMTDMEKNEAVILLGDRCDIWPESIRADSVLTSQAEQ